MCCSWCIVTMLALLCTLASSAVYRPAELVAAPNATNASVALAAASYRENPTCIKECLEPRFCDVNKTTVTFTLRAMTLNTECHPTWQEKRLEKLNILLKETPAAIVFLQGLSTALLGQLKGTSGFKRFAYNMVEPPSNAAEDNGLAILSCLPMANLVTKKDFQAKHNLPVDAIAADVLLLNRRLRIVNIQLTGGLCFDRCLEQKTERRLEELRSVFAVAQDNPDWEDYVMIAGNFNFGDGEMWKKENEFLKAQGNYTDMFQFMRPGDAGYTFDDKVNTLAKRFTDLNYVDNGPGAEALVPSDADHQPTWGGQARFDRVLMKLRWPLHMYWYDREDPAKLVATEPFQGNDEKLFISSHFGVQTHLMTACVNSSVYYPADQAPANTPIINTPKSPLNSTVEARESYRVSSSL